MTQSRTTDRPETAGVLVAPPIAFGGAFALALVLQFVRPRPIASHTLAARVAGGVLIAAGLALSGLVMRHFARADTPVIPWQETRHLVVSGPYRFSRNPDYVGQTLIVAGLGLLLRNLWVLPLLVPALLLVRYGVIAREERYLERRFGDDYRRFRSRVRRWL